MTQNTGLVGWLRQWIAPPTIVVLIGFSGVAAVSQYRLQQVEIEQTRIRAQFELLAKQMEQRGLEASQYNASTYQRRDVLIEQLKSIESQLNDMRQELRRGLR